MSKFSFSKIIFSQAATWAFRLTALGAIFLLVQFVYPGVDFSTDPGGFSLGFPTSMRLLVLTFVLCLFVSVFVVIGRLAVVLIKLYGHRRNGA